MGEKIFEMANNPKFKYFVDLERQLLRFLDSIYPSGQMFPVCFQALKCLITNIIVIGGPAVYFLQKGKYLSGYPQELLICFFSFHVLSLFIYLSLVSDADGCKAIKLVIELLSSRKRRGASLATCHFLRSSHESGVSICLLYTSDAADE